MDSSTFDNSRDEALRAQRRLAYVREVGAARRQDDPGACLRLAQKARAERDPAAVDGLGLLFTPPRGLVARWRMRQESWELVKVEALRTLSEIGTPEALARVADALFDSSQTVQENAGKTLEAAGARAVEPLLHALQTVKDWSLPAMRTVIETLGRLQDRRAAPLLVNILYDTLPGNPRWVDSLVFRTPFYLVGGGMVGLWLLLYLLYQGAPRGWAIQTLLTMFTLGLIPAFFVYMILVIVVFAPLGLSIMASQRNELAAQAAQALEQLRDKRALSRLAELAFTANNARRRFLRRALTTLLTEVEAGDTVYLEPGVHARLNEALRHHDPELALAAVRAMEHIGTGSAVRPMERLIRKGATPTIRAEAERVLPVLLERLRQEQDAVNLLRAANTPAISTDQLLRPAQNQPLTPPEQLLRVSRPSDDSTP